MKRQQGKSSANVDGLISNQSKRRNVVCENEEIDRMGLTPGEKVISIYLIRRKIFRQFCSAKDLLVCRLVCTEWEKEATAALVQPKFERALQISFRYSESSSAFISHNWKNSGKQRSLGDFLQDRILARKRLVENVEGQDDDDENEQERNQEGNLCHLNGSFLEDCCTFFKFQGGNLGTDPDSVRFFMNPESRIKSLTVHLILRNPGGAPGPGSEYNERRGVSIESFRNLLLRWGKSLKYLHIIKVPLDWGFHDSLFFGPSNQERDADPAPQISLISLPQQLEDSDFLTKLNSGPHAEFPVELCFPALQILRVTNSPFEHCPLVVRDILRGAPNLKETYYHHHGEHVEILHKEKKLHTLKSWFFSPLLPIYDNNWAAILEAEDPNPNVMPMRIQLFKFGISHESLVKWPKAIPVLNRVLKESQNSLQVIWDPLTFFNCECIGLILPKGPFNQVKKVTQGQTGQTGQPFSVYGKVDLAKLLPNVKHFKMNWSKFFPYQKPKPEMAIIDQLDLCLTSPMTSVSTCSFWFQEADICSLNEERLIKAKTLFPNVVNFTVSTSRIPKKLPQLLHLICNCFPHARAISFKFRYVEEQGFFSQKDARADFISDYSWIQRMNAVITGTDCKIKQAAETQMGFEAPEMKNEKQIQNLSILDMKDLQYFGMNFGFCFPPPHWFSKMAFDCGFDLLKSIKLEQKQNFQLEFQPEFLP